MCYLIVSRVWSFRTLLRVFDGVDGGDRIVVVFLLNSCGERKERESSLHIERQLARRRPHQSWVGADADAEEKPPRLLLLSTFRLLLLDSLNIHQELCRYGHTHVLDG